MTSREKLGGFLQDRRWMANVLDLTFQQSNRLADWGYPYPVDGPRQVAAHLAARAGYARLMLNYFREASPRGQFAGPAPWRILSDRYNDAPLTSDNHLRSLYHDVSSDDRCETCTSIVGCQDSRRAI
ncbi:hypothetical protein [Bradyrhizobium yuanmingense]|uniref:hypothetical protein n=1 Tax=Bradyrhizobium yuanmingense TaxID=108015 RepID=UPI001FEECE13|nr:hypothetical protein [Bradyrhizobium yuanmingense]